MNGRTLIDNLPDAEVISRKHILQTHQPPPESGMTQYTKNNMIDSSPQPQPQPQFYEQLKPQYYNKEVFMDTDSSQPSSSINCLEISKHVKQCPICQYYYNTNIMMYINIIGLIIIIILLLKYYK
jgi:hypothetical protein